PVAIGRERRHELIGEVRGVHRSPLPRRSPVRGPGHEHLAPSLDVAVEGHVDGPRWTHPEAGELLDPSQTAGSETERVAADDVGSSDGHGLSCLPGPREALPTVVRAGHPDRAAREIEAPIAERIGESLP